MLATSDPDTSQISGCILKYVLERCRHIPQNWDLLGWWGIQQRRVQQLPYLAVGLLQQTALLTCTGQTTSTADFGHQAQWFLLCLLDCKGLARVQTKTSPLALNEEMCCRIKPRQQALIQPNTNQYTTLASLQFILGGILQLALIVNTGGQNDFSGSLLGEIQNNL